MSADEPPRIAEQKVDATCGCNTRVRVAVYSTGAVVVESVQIVWPCYQHWR